MSAGVPASFAPLDVHHPLFGEVAGGLDDPGEQYHRVSPTQVRH
jgi:hypothetical protein